MAESLVSTVLTGGTAGLIAALLLVIILLLKGYIVPGYIYQAVETKLTRYEELAYKAMSVAESQSKGRAE